MIEAWQLSNAFDPGEKDLVFLNVAVLDLNIEDSPAPIVKGWESFEHFSQRQKIFGLSSSTWDWIRLNLHKILPWFSYRAMYRSCFLSRNIEGGGYFRHRYGDKPQAKEHFTVGLVRYSEKPKDLGKQILKENPLLALLGELKKRWGEKLVFVEVPRNPLYSRIITPEYFRQHYKVMSELGLHRFAEDTKLSNVDYHDFNHLHSKGRKRFTEQVLPAIVGILKGRGKLD